MAFCRDHVLTKLPINRNLAQANPKRLELTKTSDNTEIKYWDCIVPAKQGGAADDDEDDDVDGDGDAEMGGESEQEEIEDEEEKKDAGNEESKAKAGDAGSDEDGSDDDS